MNEVQQVTDIAKGISENGILIMIGAIYLILSASMMIALFRWFRTIINGMIRGSSEAMNELLEETRKQNNMLEDVSDGLRPETQLRIRNLSGFAFDLSVERVCRIIKKVRTENHIADRQATLNKIRVLLTNLHEDRNSKFDCFNYKGRKLSEYTNAAWVDMVSKVVEYEIYNESGENNGRAYTNVESAYANIRLEFYHNLVK